MGEESGLVRVGRTEYGRGVFATRPILAEQLVGHVDGDAIDDPDYDSEYCMELTETSVLDPRPPFRYLNHGCEPNCELVWTDYDDGSPPEMLVVALSDIAAGEQITIDYAWPASFAIPCRCGSDLCRGWIIDPCDAEFAGELSP